MWQKKKLKCSLTTKLFGWDLIDLSSPAKNVRTEDCIVCKSNLKRELSVRHVASCLGCSLESIIKGVSHFLWSS